MKKLFISAAIAATLVFSIASCQKEEESDWAGEVAGTYRGIVTDSTVSVGSTDFHNEEIIVTKIDNSHISVAAYNNGVATSFDALVTEGKDGFLLTVSPKTAGGLTVTGYPIPANGTMANGLYRTSTQEFATAIKITGGSGTIIETFIGVKQ